MHDDEILPIGTKVGVDRARGALVQLYLHAVAAGILKALAAVAAALVRDRHRTYTFAATDTPSADPQLLEIVGEIDAVAYAAEALVRQAAAELPRPSTPPGSAASTPSWRTGPRSRPPG
ncbi:acyl-CoA dehydrogenase domain-containing protein [Mycolicibacterium conceptionense]|uniref:Acyl-CoA dehydrogenase domain-containing protein n=1 Tax=Mycolicibacterium conceptionense TaxID=451644 RepID=A0A0U1DZ18_9MYCO|nr:acyl-CoA dehydrogenase domain-containing protein [Mycolicibacterium conceptionense]